MKPKLIIIRGSPATGKSILAKGLAKKLDGKIALLIVDEFRWIMTAHENRDTKDYKISFDNYLYSLKNYLKLGYTIITEDAWIRKHKDRSTDIKDVIKLGKKYNTEIHQILLKGKWKTVKHINTLRPMPVPLKELKKLYKQTYSKIKKDEIVITIDNKKTTKILKEVLKII